MHVSNSVYVIKLFHIASLYFQKLYCDVTIACDGKFYALHKFVLSTCSDYFKDMFGITDSNHPIIILTEVKHEIFEVLLNYMYVGEVTVAQEILAGLVKAAECLKIKGLAIPDENPVDNNKDSCSFNEEKNKSQRDGESPRPKKRRRENSADVTKERPGPFSKPSNQSEENQPALHKGHSENARSVLESTAEENFILDAVINTDLSKDTELPFDDVSIKYRILLCLKAQNFILILFSNHGLVLNIEFRY